MQDKTLSQRLRKLFFSTLYLSTFTFGGGYVNCNAFEKKSFVMSCTGLVKEMLDLVAITVLSGAIAVNGAIVVGYRVAGIPALSVQR